MADGLLFVGSQNDKVYAFKANGCGVQLGFCPPVWVGRTHGNVRSTPAVAYGMVFFASDDGHLYAFPESCSRSCQPVWTAAYGGTDSGLAYPSVANGVVYVTSTNKPVSIRAFGVHCATHGAQCRPLWTGTASSHFIFEGLAIAGGRLYVDGGPAAGPARLYVFGLGTAAARPGRIAPPADRAPAGSAAGPVRPAPRPRR